MKLNKIEKIIKKTELDCEVVAITLLSEEEYEKYRKYIPLVDFWWWLRSPRFYAWYVAAVYHNGTLFGAGYYYTYGGVRPALWITLPNPEGFRASDTIELFDATWTVLGVMGEQIYVLADTAITCRRFDGESNIWEMSELKELLEEWLKDKLRGTENNE